MTIDEFFALQIAMEIRKSSIVICCLVFRVLH